MIKLVVVGLWASLISVGSAFLARPFFAAKPKAATTVTPSVVSLKTKEITIPIIRAGDLKGYAVAQFEFDENTSAEAGLPTPAADQVVDAAYRLLYTNDSLNFSDLKRIDLDALTKNIEKNVNDALKRDVVSHVTIQELTLFSRKQANSQM